MPQEHGNNFFTELLKFALVAIVIVVPVRLFVAQPFIVSGASMEPTFEHGEYLIIDELSYRFGGPERGDVIIFRYPRNPKEFFIKRVVGLPGETVHIERGSISIEHDGKELKLSEPYVTNTGNGSSMEVRLSQGEYFVMGDNRPQSSDSRSWGALPRENIVGRALFRLLPIQTISLFPGSVESQ